MTNPGVWVSFVGLILFIASAIWFIVASDGGGVAGTALGLLGFALQFVGYWWMRATIRRRAR